MIRQFALYFVVASAVAGMASCNSEDTPTPTQTATSAAVSTFSLGENDSIVENLDSVFFSIDLVKGLIFNADSLPMGTEVTGLNPVITTLNGCSVAELTVSRADKPDTVYNYLENSSCLIDFTRPVKLRIVSPDGLVERNYTISVNVHTVATDTLVWPRDDRRPLPSTFTYPTAQHTVQQGDRLHCLTASSTGYCMASLQTSLSDITGYSPDLGAWDTRAVSFPATPRPETLAASPDALFIICDDGRLYTSTDGTSWTATPMSWSWIYGAYGNTLLGVTRDAAGNPAIQSYPSGVTTPLPVGMPVSGTAAPVTYSFSMSTNPQMLIVGGRKADGSLSADTWGYDGSSWARISKRPLPMGIAEAAVAPYVSLSALGTWSYTELPTLILLGGRTANGKINTDVYMSNDYGFNWRKAPDCMQLPDYFPALYNAQLLTITSTIGIDDRRSRISRPVTEWETPYLYLYGGVNANGATSNNVWRGVITQLSLKPVM